MLFIMIKVLLHCDEWLNGTSTWIITVALSLSYRSQMYLNICTEKYNSDNGWNYKKTTLIAVNKFILNQSIKELTRKPSTLNKF